MHSFVYQNVMQKMQKIPADTSKRLHLLGLQDFGRMQGILEKHGGNHAECVDGHRLFLGAGFFAHVARFTLQYAEDAVGSGCSSVISVLRRVNLPQHFLSAPPSVNTIYL